ncbi:UDP-N-acetyl-D-glucosamine 2-epimerase, UDP-hydrolysing [Pseudalgibacter alginicilyticus]|uniref:UDP-N-acetyl-D-glucosamine 2-epimerase, UDP-hydrolysing n=1 Tax=Pseudalgibacter alginicilyticus TaxID=1736674 RepID=A0A0P0D786_9FLAO|nr:UDP-N-acetylglucosamine 2-epimerase [Pseudalgibacter alginicilyticus]ALJ04584.1 UDP-N-acetyl-D-glucosamine 2-epimerase, UDP-hydrolysing [Pseudalgibacter alginicilyticus]
MPKKIAFLTGTRADFGKMKPLIQILETHKAFEAYIFVTGMHLLETYGYTLIEVERCGFKHISTFRNDTHEASMDLTLAKTITGFSEFVKNTQPDLIVIHGDRVEALAGAIVGSLNNILVAHVEGGELSGTIDELMRHATSKMSHIHFVANEKAKSRLEQMGELPESIFSIGSPDVDIMFSNALPELEIAKSYYDISFETYAIAMFHPVTTEHYQLKQYIENFVEALIQSNKNYVVVYPNNDLGSQAILDAYQNLLEHPNFRIFPSIRFEYFLSLLKHSEFIIGNSSAGVREAPYYGIPTINIGTRQHNRVFSNSIINSDYSTFNILKSINQIKKEAYLNEKPDFGNGNSAQEFLKTLQLKSLWKTNHQKQFREL